MNFVHFSSIATIDILNDAKGMVGLKAHEFFSSFMRQKGIIRDNELREIERVIEELNVPLRKFYERNIYLEVQIFGGVEVRWYSLLCSLLLETLSGRISSFLVLTDITNFR